MSDERARYDVRLEWRGVHVEDEFIYVPILGPLDGNWAESLHYVLRRQWHMRTGGPIHPEDWWISDEEPVLVIANPRFFRVPRSTSELWVADMASAVRDYLDDVFKAANVSAAEGLVRRDVTDDQRAEMSRIQQEALEMLREQHPDDEFEFEERSRPWVAFEGDWWKSGGSSHDDDEGDELVSLWVIDGIEPLGEALRETARKIDLGYEYAAYEFEEAERAIADAKTPGPASEAAHRAAIKRRRVGAEALARHQQSFPPVTPPQRSPRMWPIDRRAVSSRRAPGRVA